MEEWRLLVVMALYGGLSIIAIMGAGYSSKICGGHWGCTKTHYIAVFDCDGGDD